MISREVEIVSLKSLMALLQAPGRRVLPGLLGRAAQESRAQVQGVCLGYGQMGPTLMGPLQQ